MREPRKVKLSEAPNYEWYYGCAPTAAGMLLGFYDRNGYDEAGYSNLIPGGIAELETFSGSDYIVHDVIASPEHIEDYYVAYNHYGDDPNPGGHEDNCLADFMETSKDSAENSDGSSSFWYWQSGDLFTLEEIQLYDLEENSSIYGIAEWIWRQGYDVATLSNGYIDGYVSGGCTFDDFCREIDAGRPALLHLDGHVMMAYGYAFPDTVYVKDTWDEDGYYGQGSLRWGSSYVTDSGPMSHVAMTFMTMNGGETLQAEKPLYFPHVDTTGGWESEICFINSGDDTASIRLLALDDEGEEVAEERDYELLANSRNELLISCVYDEAPLIRQCVLYSTSTDVTGYLKFYKDGKYRVSIPAVATGTQQELVIPHIASDAYWWTGLALVNTTELDKTLTLEFDNSESKTILLPAGGHRAFTIRSLFSDQAQPDKQWAVLKQAEGVVGLQLFGGGSQLSGNLLFSDSAPTLYYPHVACDENWWTGIAACNYSKTATDVAVRPYAQDGTALAPTTITLLPGEKYLGTAKALDMPEQTAWFSLASDNGLTGVELFGTHNGWQLAGYGCVNIATRNGIFPKLEDDGWTGISFVNTASTPAEITLFAYNDSGVLLANEILRLEGHEKTVGVAQDLFAEDISGASYVRFTSEQDVVGFQLNGSSDGMMLDVLPAL
ncbi:hypothetical protein [uncultured Desulfuromonas sp.]|uniref:hypothetical protein n=1 Tax=uncultured Desulfuromonas sp. TaxID=181013 RepID=UPI002AAB4AED|nr:hypothetical protein [uncultured Desulfuromonas sp.]